MSGFTTPTKPNIADYLMFLRQGVGIGPAFLPDDSLWVQTSFDIAMGTVNLALMALPGSSPTAVPIYVLAVYNLAADRLLNFALDEPGQCYFRDLRSSLGLNAFMPGFVTASADQGTSQTLALIESVKNFTVTDLQMMKTPYGRMYIDFAQNYGPYIWGLT